MTTTDVLRWALCAHDVLYRDCKNPICVAWIAGERKRLNLPEPPHCERCATRLPGEGDRCSHGVKLRNDCDACEAHFRGVAAERTRIVTIIRNWVAAGGVVPAVDTLLSLIDPKVPQ